MALHLLTWRVPAELMAPAGDSAAHMVHLANEPSKEARAVLEDPAYRAVSHTLTYDPDGLILSVLFAESDH